MNEKLEQAKALGFASVEACEDHQKWLHRQRIQKAAIRKAVEASKDTGVIDLTGVN